MSQEKPIKGNYTISILGTARSDESEKFFGVLNRFHLLMIINKERIILTIPAWPVIAALVVFLILKAASSRRSGQS